MADDFDASDYERPRKDRFTVFLERYRACNRAQASIDAAQGAVHAAWLDVHNEMGGKAPGVGALEEVRRELLAAEMALRGAREKLANAVAEKKLTPENRQPEYWKGGT